MSKKVIRFGVELTEPAAQFFDWLQERSVDGRFESNTSYIAGRFERTTRTIRYWCEELVRCGLVKVKDTYSGKVFFMRSPSK